MKKEKIFVIIVCGIFILCSGILYLSSGTSSDSTEKYGAVFSKDTETSDMQSDTATSETDSGVTTNDKSEITVYICGAVSKPGVYRFSEDARVCDGISAAGGFKKNAAKTYVNQAQPMKDGEQITIPTKKQIKKQKENDNSLSALKHDSASEEGLSLININTASVSELIKITGIGQSKAAAIESYRTENGSFTCIEDIMKVPGIKEGIFNQIKSQITI